MYFLHLIGASALLLCVAAPAHVAAQERAGFLVRIGTDTFAVERFTRSDERLTGELVLRSPRTRVVRYDATLAPDGSVTRAEITTGPAPGASGRTVRSVMRFDGDGVSIDTRAGDSTSSRRVDLDRPAMPFINGGYAFYEAAIIRARQAGKNEADVVFVVPGSGNRVSSRIVMHGRDSVLVDYFGDPIRIRVDGAGHVLAWDGRATTAKMTFERLPDADVEGMTRSFASRDAGGQSLGTLSPRDTVRARVGAAELMVDYGRPGKRGRTIFGGIEPWGSVWRTGANAATQLETSADLTIGGQLVPRGRYTLWILLDERAPQLIINRQTGQWGTEYDAAQDLVRVPLQVTSLPELVERFTIGIAPEGSLTFEWDRTRFSVPVIVR
ncbi:MAG TPA: DUF2911 domain-containing protein [Gemmatimonadaceae bacterium]|nr:DUF2911 domain-containing protein [Gemmatimonadaceae bacterium]